MITVDSVRTVVVPWRFLSLVRRRVLLLTVLCFVMGFTAKSEAQSYEDRVTLAQERLRSSSERYDTVIQSKISRVRDRYSALLSRLELSVIDGRETAMTVTSDDIGSLIDMIERSEINEAGTGGILAGIAAVLTGGLVSINLDLTWGDLSNIASTLYRSVSWEARDLPIDILEESITEIENEMENLEATLSRIIVALTRIENQLDRLRLLR